MITIIEGLLDGIGKSTLATTLASKLNYRYVHESYTDNDGEKLCRVLLMLSRVMTGENIIYDRTTLIDDFVYCFLNKNESSLIEYQDIIISILNKCKIINLNLDEKIRLKRFNDRGDQFITNDQIEQIKANYDAFYSKLDNVINIELTGDLKTDCQLIEKEIKNGKDNANSTIRHFEYDRW